MQILRFVQMDRACREGENAGEDESTKTEVMPYDFRCDAFLVAPDRLRMRLNSAFQENPS